MNLVLCIDGTWENGDGSNVHRISRMACDDALQKVFYCAGPGTRFGSLLLGGLICADAHVILKSCRDFIRANEGTWCDIYVFGFSRGAFLARVLCDMAAREGVKIRFLGCFDTVAATPLYDAAAFRDVSANVALARHAVAINEVRTLFDYLPMRGRVVRENFFAGCHGDVGGTYRDERTLGDIVLRWMLRPAVKAGLRLDGAGIALLRGRADYAAAKVHDALRGPALRRRIVASRLHASVRRLPWRLFRRVARRLVPLYGDEIVAVVAKGRKNSGGKGGV